LRSHPATFLLAFTIAVIRPNMAAESIAYSETVAEFAVRYLSEEPTGIVTKCVAEVPSMKKDFDAAMLKRHLIITAVAKRLMSEPRFELDTREVVPSDVAAFYPYMPLEGVTPYVGVGHDARHYCKRLLKELRDIQGALLASRLEQTISKVEIYVSFSKNPLSF
jgi:hypothetical protein